MDRQIITQMFIIDHIDSLLQLGVNASQFGDEMSGYLTFGDKYTLEAGYKELLRKCSENSWTCTMSAHEMSDMSLTFHLMSD